MSLLTVQGLTKKYADGFIAVNNISFDIKSGEILGLLGPNGAGKTTIITMLLSTLTPTSGRIFYFGKDFFMHRSEILKYVSYASTYVKLPPRLTIWENLDIYGRLYGLSYAQRYDGCKKLLTLFGMWDIRHREMGALSAGQITRVMLVKAFVTQPKIVLLDEPTAALDPDIAIDVRKFILEQQKEHGISVLLTSHNMDEVTEMCDRVLVLKNGAIIAQDTPEKLASTISQARVRLIIAGDMQRVVATMQENNWAHIITDTIVEIFVDEHKIAQLLMHLAHNGIAYEHIAIEKPTLEDYFLHIVKKV
ncbi:MAG: ABC transporter ATP-binding protein [Candidatus Babeliaceae bacterium]|jgi:ABC-2 type transport system ATP-binding protein